MKIKVREILLAVDSGALERLLNQGVPAKGAWKIQRMLRKVRVEYGDAQALRSKLFTDENSVESVTNPGQRSIKPECIQAFASDPLFDQESDIDVEPITFDDIAGASISVADLEKLGPLVAE